MLRGSGLDQPTHSRFPPWLLHKACSERGHIGYAQRKQLVYREGLTDEAERIVAEGMQRLDLPSRT